MPVCCVAAPPPRAHIWEELVYNRLAAERCRLRPGQVRGTWSEEQKRLENGRRHLLERFQLAIHHT